MSAVAHAMSLMNAPRELKKSLPIPWVLEQAGVRLELQGAQLVARCPFHPDSEPSFYVTDEGERGWRWGCWPCGLSGDVVDLIKALYGIGFTDAVSAGIRGVLRIQETGWKAPVLEASGVFDGPAARELLAQARAQGDTVQEVDRFLWSKRLDISSHWLTRTWDLAALNGQLLVPVYSRNRELVGIKHRRLDGSDHLYAFPGSALGDVLYGEDRAGSDAWPVLLCEGESDTWLASWLTRDLPWTVLGLSTGAGSPTRPAERLAGREVHILFDGDDAGRAGAARWQAATGGQVWALPEGQDICSYVRAGGTLDFLTGKMA